jgi:enediyne biosynthesis protein E4
MNKLLLIPFLLVIVLVAVVIVRFTLDKNIPYDVSTKNITVPTFKEIDLDFDQKLSDAESLPFTASAVIDIDNDGTEELFIGGGPDQKDALFKFVDGQFKLLDPNIIEKPEMQDATFGSSVIDVDANGLSDLIVSRISGVWLYLNENGRFSEKNLIYQ